MSVVEIASAAPSAVLQDEFRAVMGRVATPVAVITTLSDTGPYGTTVSAFASLSMEPPMVLVSLDQRSDLLAEIRRTGRFGVNILGTDHAELALTFARKGGPDKFDGIDWELDGELPHLPGADWLTLYPGGLRRRRRP